MTVRQAGLTGPVPFVKSVSSDYIPSAKIYNSNCQMKDLKKSKTGWIFRG